MERGFFLTLQAMRRQLAAMPCDLYLIRLIHSRTHQADPGERIWNSVQLLHGSAVSFLRLRNRQGFDVYFHPFAGDHNAGYILLDLDQAGPNTIPTMRAQGHPPCVILQTSPAHLQAWVRVSLTPLEPALATAIGKQLARTYGGDLASTDWRHLGRLAGFTNQKPTRRPPGGYAPWVRLLYAHAGLAPQGTALLDTAQHSLLRAPVPPARGPLHQAATDSAAGLTAAAALRIYARWLERLHILERFPQPDWSIADLWIAKELMLRRVPAAQIQAVLRLGSPSFPRRHPNPTDYLHRTLARAARELSPTAPFSPYPSAPPV